MLRVLRLARGYSNIRERIKLERESRLAKGPQAKTLTMKTQDDQEKIRNIGIIAHIDAGKTTSTERMLYYAGALPSPGNIDEGTTTMDFMTQERQRGITIRSAAISFNWNNHQINLIDTPGHVDFSGEVTRSLQVLDGVVTIMDGVKGVESQTQKVWSHAEKTNIPRICFINKMDRIGSSVIQTAQQIKERLQAEPLILQYPIGEAETFKGVVDLIEMQDILFKGQYGEQVQRKKIELNTEKHNAMIKQRNKMIELVGSYDEMIEDMYLRQQYISASTLKKAIRALLVSGKSPIAPILLGTSLKNKGVQPLLDSVVSYLPSPLDRPPAVSFKQPTQKRQSSKHSPFTAYIFKVLYDLEKGPLHYSRIYAGEISKGVDIFNNNKKSTEKIGQILRVRANQYVPINEVSAGDIIAFAGLKESGAGDTLSTSPDDDFILQPLNVPQPIFTVPFILQSTKHERQFKDAIHKAVIEDNSLSFKYEEETNQYLLSGLGELHLEILRDKLSAQGIPTQMGNLIINFKETISEPVSESISVSNVIKPGVIEEFHISISLNPFRTGEQKIEEKNQILFQFNRVKGFDENWAEFLKRKQMSKKGRKHVREQNQEANRLKKIPRNPTPIEPLYEDVEGEDEVKEEHQKPKHEEHFYHINTLPFETLYELHEICNTALLSGKYNLPTRGISLQIVGGKYKKSSFSKSIMNKTTTSLVRSVITKKSNLIEPMMKFNVHGQENALEMLVSDIMKKRGRIDERQNGEIKGVIPAEGVRGWLKELRAMGLEAEFKFDSYEEVIGINPEKLLQSNL